MGIFRDGIVIQACVLYISHNGGLADHAYLAGWFTVHGYLAYKLLRRLHADAQRTREAGSGANE